MKNLKNIIHKFPMLTFFVVLLGIFAIIFLGKQMRSEEDTQQESKKTPKSVHIFSAKNAVQAPISGEVDRADTVVLRATANGIVTRAIGSGARVTRGQELVKLSDTYAGTSQVDLSAAIAQRNYLYQQETVGTRKDILKAQDKEINKTDDRAAKIARKQNFLQQRSVDLSFDTAKLQASQAAAISALYKTVAPLSGVVEEVAVRVGDTVQAGQIIAILKADNRDDVRIVAHVGAARAAHIDVEGTIIAKHHSREIPLELVHIASSSAGDGSYALTFRTPKDTLGDIGDGSFIHIDVPLQSDQDLLVPLDSVRFGTEVTEVYIAQDGVARAMNVEIGEVVGSYIIIKNGVDQDAMIITDRSVTDGEEIAVVEDKN